MACVLLPRVGHPYIVCYLKAISAYAPEGLSPGKRILFAKALPNRGG